MNFETNSMIPLMMQSESEVFRTKNQSLKRCEFLNRSGVSITVVRTNIPLNYYYIRECALYSKL